VPSSPKKWTGWGSIGLVVVALAFFVYYYVTTRAETLVVEPPRFPSNFSPGFSEVQLADSLLASIEELREGAKKQSASRAQPGIQLASSDAAYVSWQISTPTFDQKVRKVSANMLRQWALTAKARYFLTLDATKARENSFRLSGMIKDRPDFAIKRSWRVPMASDSCQTEEACTLELAEDILGFRETHTLILYYLKERDKASLEKILNLYNSGIIAPVTPADDYAWGDALQLLNRYDEAILKYRDAISTETGTTKVVSCPANDQIGTVYIRKYEMNQNGEYLQSAVDAFGKALECNPKDAVAHCDLGNVFIRKWKESGLKNDSLRRKAIAESNEALKIDPKLAEAAVNLGYVQYMQGQPKPALEYFRKISEKFPQNSAVFVNFGFLLFREYLKGDKGVLQEAIDKTRRAWELDQKSYIAAGNLAALYYEADMISNALQLWDKAYELNPSSADIVAGYALGLFKSGKQTEAITRYKEALVHDPKIADPARLKINYLWTDKMIHDFAALVTAAEASQGV
jgi:tetratricopeptide (TPR) repeat protein